jgi:hypothetical protein
MSLSEKPTAAPAGDGSKAAKPAAAAVAPEDTNLDLLEEDDEFEEFPAESTWETRSGTCACALSLIRCSTMRLHLFPHSHSRRRCCLRCLYFCFAPLLLLVACSLDWRGRGWRRCAAVG